MIPTAERERILALDVLRGFALFGVFVVNASYSARPLADAVEMPAGSTLAEQIAWLVLNGVCVTKFVALFSFLFGMGLVLQCRRIVERGESTRIYLRRLAWLALFGLVHGCVLFEGDILLPYAVAGLILYGVRDRSPGFLVGGALVLLAIGMVLEVPAARQGLPEDSAHESLLAYAREEGSVLVAIRVRMIEYAGWLWMSSVSLFNWQVLALFFLGAAAMKRGWLQGEPRRFRRTAVVGLCAGTLLELAAFGLSIVSGSAPARIASALTFSVGCLFLAAGYTGAVVAAVRAERFPRLQRALAAVGRMALSNYVAQSVLMNVLFQPFGLRLWNELSRWQVIAIVAVLFAVQVAVSAVWMKHFAMGPLEWLWRRLTYGRGVTGERLLRDARG